MSTPVIQLRELVRTYQTGEVEVKAVRGVTLDIHRGEFVAIMGSSGSGKSTLMNTLGCLDKPTSGTYLLDGVAVAGLDRKRLAKLRNKKLSFVFQSFNLLARTSAQENVELPLFYSYPLVTLGNRHNRSVQALDKVGLGQRRDHLPSQLSGDNNSALPSPVRSSASQRFCSPTSQPATSTPAPALKSWVCSRS